MAFVSLSPILFRLSFSTAPTTSSFPRLFIFQSGIQPALSVIITLACFFVSSFHFRFRRLELEQKRVVSPRSLKTGEIYGRNLLLLVSLFGSRGMRLMPAFVPSPSFPILTDSHRAGKSGRRRDRRCDSRLKGGSNLIEICTRRSSFVSSMLIGKVFIGM